MQLSRKLLLTASRKMIGAKKVSTHQAKTSLAAGIMTTETGTSTSMIGTDHHTPADMMAVSIAAETMAGLATRTEAEVNQGIRGTAGKVQEHLGQGEVKMNGR